MSFRKDRLEIENNDGESQLDWHTNFEEKFFA